ncbi:MAG TPA: nickel-binding protein [Micromonosporaceae bacterium]
MAQFLVERYLPSTTAAEVNAAVDRLMRAPRTGVRHLFTLLVIGEETGLSCFEATDRGCVVEANEAADFPFDRIVEVTMYRG